MKWEKIDKAIYRTKIPNGWLVKFDSDDVQAGGLTFVPDKLMVWEIN